MWKKWEDLPRFMQTEEVRPYYEVLRRKRLSLAAKRGADFILAVVMLIVLLPVMVGISIAIVMDSRGGVFFRQERVTQYGRKFRILKYRTMVANAEKLGAEVTVADDRRVTKIGKILRRYRLDELPQLINILLGDMSFCGTRPEIPRFVREYTKEMLATLLLPAGVTSEACIKYKDEERLLESAESADEIYIRRILPGKMKYNLESIRDFGLLKEFKTIAKTGGAVMR